jgi:hypothetical protein
MPWAVEVVDDPSGQCCVERRVFERELLRPRDVELLDLRSLAARRPDHVGGGIDPHAVDPVRPHQLAQDGPRPASHVEDAAPAEVAQLGDLPGDWIERVRGGAQPAIPIGKPIEMLARTRRE